MAFIYIPIFVMIVFSFNAGMTTTEWNGSSSRWYEALFHNSPFLKAFLTSLFVAMISTMVSLVIGVSAALGLTKTRPRTRNTWFNLANIPLINADVVTAVSLMLIFLLANFRFGLLTLILAHISFNVPYVLVTVMPRARKINKASIEAGFDLGANRWQVLWRVIIPTLMPSIIAAAAIAFAMSFDDFIISYFTSGPLNNVATIIYTAKKIRPYVFAFGTLIVLAIVFAIIVWNAVIFAHRSRELRAQQILQGTYRSGELNRLNKQLVRLETMANSGQKIKFSFRLDLWLWYWETNLRIKLANLKDYDKRISRLQWKEHKLRSRINMEQRYYTRQKNAERRLQKLTKQLAKSKNVAETARLTLQIQKVEERLGFLKNKIEIIENQENLGMQKAALLKKDLYQLRKTDPLSLSGAELRSHKRRIRNLESERFLAQEGKTAARLKKVRQRLERLQKRKYNQVSELTELKNRLYQRLHQPQSLTQRYDVRITLAKSNYHRARLIKIRTLHSQRIETRLVRQINHKNAEIARLQQAIAKETNRFNQKYAGDGATHAHSWWSRSWKMVVALTVGIAAFTGLTVAYVINNTFDLVIGNWGEYIDHSLIGEFQKKYHVKVNYQEYDSNETLYNKLFTFNYDLMVPSDYMVQKLAQENYLEELDWDKINIAFDTPFQAGEETPVQKWHIDPSLLTLMENYRFKVADEDKSLKDFSIPYFWGDLIIAVNPTPANKAFLQEQGLTFDETTGLINQNKLDWSLLLTAANANKRVVLNNDPKNIFSIGAQILYQRPNLTSKAEVNAVSNLITDFVQRKNVSLNSDEIVDILGSHMKDFWDFALVYNGDGVAANQIYNGDDGEEFSTLATKTKFLFGRPNLEVSVDGQSRFQTTNVFSDNIVIGKRSSHKTLAYEFINFLLEHDLEITRYVGTTSPIVEVNQELALNPDGPLYEYQRMYLPGIEGEPSYNLNGDEPLAFSYNPLVDDYLVNEFNNIVAGKHG